ncbi:hypothetical protein H5410_010301 [Solanum commersonii]|uniref:Uncharacterized protein n=1 Tax=Solanum commersonii TaxID=4109 RepID=A0A9J6ALB8_SOLCO|nr:hypothetical protein H5410_010301 [Solanum commersonii]
MEYHQEPRVVEEGVGDWEVQQEGVDQNTNVAPKETTTTRKGKGAENTTQFKRPRVTGMGVFQAENDFKTFNATLLGE